MNNIYKYIDKINFQKKLKSLKKYCPAAYKDLIFNKNNIFLNAKNGTYCKKLKTSNEFKFVYGQIELIYKVKNNIITIVDINPSQFFIDGYITELKTYKGFFYRDQKDIFKIDLITSMETTN